jgi:choline kinase
MRDYKVVIPSAGIGSRLGSITKNFNKALVTIGEKPSICHIIDKFPADVEVIVLLGYKGDHVRQVLKAVYPDRKITFVEVNPYEGDGSGLGVTLGHARDHLQCPFIFAPNDTIVRDDVIDLNPNQNGNWIGYYDAKPGDRVDVSSYRTIDIGHDKRLITINPKGAGESDHVYIGLCGVKDYKAFWGIMESPAATEIGESYALKSLPQVKTVEIRSWCDTGNLISLEITRDKFKSSEFNILEKEDEAIWFFDDRVVKFSIHDAFISERIKRMGYDSFDLFPELIATDTNLYVYRKIQGEVITDIITPELSNSLLDVMQAFWWSKTQDIDLTPVLHEFYRKKTYERLAHFSKRFETPDVASSVNGVDIPSAREMLDGLDWDWLCTSDKVSMFHGDFHNENILIDDDSGRWRLIDWRQNFGKIDGKPNYFSGDVYYDLAKFYHGLIVSHGQVHANNFKVKSDGIGVVIDILRPMHLVEVEEAFLKWVEENGYDVRKVKILTALIFINICGLHEYPYSIFLYNLGKHLLYKWTK